MKKISLLLFSAIYLSSCVGDNYYEQLNSAPSINLETLTDTIKVSPVSYSDQVSNLISCQDFNRNLRSLSVNNPSSEDLLIMDEKNNPLESPIQIGNNIESFFQKVSFKAKKAGDYVVKFTAQDAFQEFNSVEYKIHAFNNLVPVAVINSATITGNTLNIEMKDSFDQDAKYGGNVSSYLILFDGEEELEFYSSTINILVPSSLLNLIKTNLYVAVKDNDGAISSKIKINFK